MVEVVGSSNQHGTLVRIAGSDEVGGSRLGAGAGICGALQGVKTR